MSVGQEVEINGQLKLSSLSENVTVTGRGLALDTWIADAIRTGKAYDGVIDFDAAVRDPMAPSKIQMKYNPGDNLHMNDAGYQAMAAAIDLALFKR